MMKQSVKFLKDELWKLSVRFPFVNIKYGYDSLIETHIVELLPLSEYNNNKDLDNSWIPLSVKFIEAFNEEIAFISSDSPLSLKEVIFEYNKGNNLDENIITKLFSSLSEKKYRYHFSTKIDSGLLIKEDSLIVLTYEVEEYDDVDYSECSSYLDAA